MNFYILKHWRRYASLVPAEGVDYQSDSLAIRLLEKGEMPRLDEEYVPIEVSPDKTKVGDLAHWRSVVLSQRAVDALGPLLSDVGVFYPLNVKGAPQAYWLFVITNVIDCLDEDSSEGRLTEIPLNILRANNYDLDSIYWEPDVKFSFLDKVKLKTEALEGRNSILFSLPHYGNEYIFVNDDFRLAVEKNELVGFVLIPEGVSLAGCDDRNFIINKNIKPLINIQTFSKSEGLKIEDWVLEVKRLSNSTDGLDHLRERVYEGFSAKLDAQGLENFYRQAAKKVLGPLELSAFLGLAASASMEKYIFELEKSIVELKNRMRQKKEISAVYFEYYYDGTHESSGNFFLCTDYDQDSDDWRTLFDGEEGVVLGPPLPDCFYFDSDEGIFGSEEKRVFALAIADGLLAAQLLKLWIKNRLQKCPLAYASHEGGVILLVK